MIKLFALFEGERQENSMEAIVYTSNSGHTKEYAELLGKETGLEVYDLKTAVKQLNKKTEIIYMGWLMAGNVMGFKKAAKRFNIRALCGVGMAKTGSQLEDIRKTNALPGDLTVFCLQGGFEIEKLHGIYKLMMSVMKNTVGKGLSDKQNRTPEEDEMLDLMLNGGNKVSIDNLTDVLAWYGKQDNSSDAFDS